MCDCFGKHAALKGSLAFLDDGQVFDLNQPIGEIMPKGKLVCSECGMSICYECCACACEEMGVCTCDDEAKNEDEVS